jgi:hypothetical protein
MEHRRTVPEQQACIENEAPGNIRIVVAQRIVFWQVAYRAASLGGRAGRFQVKNTKHPSGKKTNPSTQERRASTLRVLRDSALKSVKGGTGDGPPPPSTDPIC